ncbi:tRNA uracil 4-sulfurtransferase ThiI [Heyndrickxia acidicola]|uniref:Probable tRNA sulfurtransferase n=1 Tax=Heyndrickxia acidicola TaxID=209389 RepID=A0ABU6MFJ5_9BACI|nr:tRNA uracil 4-sulfurtransferase ThiI [Heyndrickxia acidicola]MED1203184.1 tRNA 4-thiouridine(8) synthase ThiI [Heyndrickxia acidicola]
MKYDRILIRYGELSTKGKNRSHFISTLKRNIRNTLNEFENISIQGGHDRMYILLNGENSEPIIERLSKVFGIQSFSLAVRTNREIGEIQEVGLNLVQQLFFEGATFKVSTRRGDKSFELDTNEINHAVGSHILKNIEGLKVDVRNPDIDLLVDVRSEGVYLSSEIIKGAGGLPVGSSGKAMLMLSGGIDSPVAGYMVMKRGVQVEAVHFHSPPFTSPRAKQKVIDLARKIAHFSGAVKVHIVPFTKVQETIHKQIPESYTMTATRRMMLRITDEVRRKNNGLAIITGESLGQVASQTLESMVAINDVTSTPIIRPLVAMDKLDIIDIAKRIDTFEISNLPYEDCCTIFTPPSPKTKPKLEKIQHFESFLDFTPFLEEAVAGTESFYVYPGEDEAAIEEFEGLL